MSKRYVYRPGHPRANERGFVDWNDLGWEQEKRAVNAPIMAGRFYENTAATDGTDIGSRKRHREYMHSRGLTTADDYPKFWDAKAKERAVALSPEWDQKGRRDDIARTKYELEHRRK